MVNRVCRSFKACYLGPILLGLLAAGLVLVATHPQGAGLTHDSIQYITAARSVQTGEGFISLEGKPFVFWPPLLPALLSTSNFFAITPEELARYVNAVAFGMSAAAVGGPLSSWALS